MDVKTTENSQSKTVICDILSKAFSFLSLEYTKPETVNQNFSDVESFTRSKKNDKESISSINNNYDDNEFINDEYTSDEEEHRDSL